MRARRAAVKTPPGAGGVWPTPGPATPARAKALGPIQTEFPKLLAAGREDSAGTRGGPQITEAAERPHSSVAEVRRVAIAVFAAPLAGAPGPHPKRRPRRRQRQKARGDQEP